MNFPPKKILVPVDMTPASMTAWKRAQDLCRRFGAVAEALFVRQLAYVVGGLGFGPSEAGMLVQAGAETPYDLKKMLGGDAKTHVATGLPAEEITDFAEKNGFDLILLGTHGRHGLERAILGSVAEDVARLSRVPVLVVRSDVGNISAILAPLNEAEHSQAGLRYADQAARAFKRKVRVLRITEGDPAKAIAADAGERDLIVLVSRPGKGLRERVLGSTPERLLRRSHSSVLIFPAGTRSAPAETAGRKPANAFRGRRRAGAKKTLRQSKRKTRQRHAAAAARRAVR